MTSAKKSIIPEFKQTLTRLGCVDDFEITEQSAVNKESGSFIMFSGVKTSSGDQTANLKSIVGITTFVVEEGEDFTDEAAFNTINRSIRTKDKQNRVIWIMNPTYREHFIYRKWIEPFPKKITIEGETISISGSPKVEHIHTTYHIATEFLDNEWISEAQELKRTNPKEYYNAYLGGWKETPEGVVFEKWNIGEFPTDYDYCYYGLDFGYAKDPAAMVQIVAKGDNLYVRELLYDTGLNNQQLALVFKDLGINSKDPIIADSAEPKSIDEIFSEGFNILPAVKGSDSINYGINLIKKYNLIVSKESLNLQKELYNYKWGQNRIKDIIPKPEDKWNHLIDALRYGVGELETSKNFVLV